MMSDERSTQGPSGKSQRSDPRLGVGLVGVLLIAAIWAAAAVTVHRQRDLELDRAIARTTHLARAFEEHVVRTLDAVDQVLERLKREQEARRAPVTDAELAEERHAHGTVISAITLIDAAGNVTASSLSYSHGGGAEHIPSGVLAAVDAGQAEFGAPVLAPTTNSWSLPMMRGFSRPDGAFAGRIVASIDVEYFVRFYRDFDLGGGGLVALVGRDGEVRVAWSQDGRGVRRDVGAGAPFLAAIRSGERVSSSVMAWPDDGGRHVVSHRALAHYPLAVVVGISEREALAAADGYARNYYGGAAAFTLAIALLGVFAGRELQRRRAAQRALRASEKQFAAFNLLGSDWYWETDSEYRFKVISDDVPLLAGRPAADLLGKACWDLEFMEPDRGGWEEHRRTIGQRAAFHNLTVRHTAADGSVRYGRVEGEPFYSSDGQFLGYRGIGRDTTGEVRLLQRLRLQHRVSQIIVSADAGPQAVTEILRAICETGGWQWAARRVLDRVGGELACAEWWCEPELANSEFLAMTRDVTTAADREGMIWRTVESGEPQWWISAPGAWCKRREESLRGAGLRAGLAIPVLIGPRAESAFEIFGQRAERPDRMLLDTLLAVGREVGQYLVRLAAEEARSRLEHERAELVAAMHFQLECMPFACVVKDREFRIVFWNAAAERIFGYTSEQALGRTPFELITPESAQAHVEAIWTRLRAGAAAERSINENVTKQGATIVCEWHNTSFRDARGELLGYISIAQDITERLKTDQALRESEERYRNLFEQTPLPLLVCETATLRLLGVNQAAVEKYGYSREEFLAMTILDLQVAEDRDAVAQELRERDPSVEAFYKRRHMRKNGDVMVMEVTACPLRYRGQAARLVLLNDVTEQQRMEQRLRESEEQFQQLANNIPEGFWISDVDVQKTLYVSPAAAQLVGRPLAEITVSRRALIGAVHKEDRPRVHAARKRAALGQYDETYRVVHPDGTVRWVRDRAFPVRDADGRVYRIAGIAEDITAQRQAQEALRTSEGLLRATFEQAAVGIGLRDTDPYRPRWLRVNQKLCDILGYERDELLQMTAVEIVPPEEREAAIEINERLLHGRITTLSREKRYVRKDGRVIWANVSLSAVAGPDGTPAYVICVVEDITEHKRAEAEVLRLNAELEQSVAERTAELVAANRELEAFSYSVSHDLRAPLRALDGFSQMLMAEYENRLDVTGREYLRRLRAGSQRMGLLIDDLLRLSRATRHELRREKCDLSALVGEVLADIRRESLREVDVSVRPGMNAEADPSLLRVVLDNLLQNAWKFTLHTQQPGIEVGCELVNGETVYYVMDNGAGFDMRYADKLFTPFQRLHGEAEFSGTGIGLAIVQRVVQRHGGRIWAESAPGAGAAFYFTLAPRDLSLQARAA